jgi:hypothetical protein
MNVCIQEQAKYNDQYSIRVVKMGSGAAAHITVVDMYPIQNNMYFAYCLRTEDQNSLRVLDMLANIGHY